MRILGRSYHILLPRLQQDCRLRERRKTSAPDHSPVVAKRVNYSGGTKQITQVGGILLQGRRFALISLRSGPHSAPRARPALNSKSEAGPDRMPQPFLLPPPSHPIESPDLSSVVGPFVDLGSNAVFQLHFRVFRAVKQCALSVGQYANRIRLPWPFACPTHLSPVPAATARPFRYRIKH